MWCDADALWDKLPGSTVGGGSRLHFHQNYADIKGGSNLDPTPNPTAGFWGKMTDSEPMQISQRRSTQTSSSQQTILQKLQSILRRKKEKQTNGIKKKPE